MQAHHRSHIGSDTSLGSVVMGGHCASSNGADSSGQSMSFDAARQTTPFMLNLSAAPLTVNSDSLSRESTLGHRIISMSASSACNPSFQLQDADKGAGGQRHLENGSGLAGSASPAPMMAHSVCYAANEDTLRDALGGQLGDYSFRRPSFPEGSPSLQPRTQVQHPHYDYATHNALQKTPLIQQREASELQPNSGSCNSLSSFLQKQPYYGGASPDDSPAQLADGGRRQLLYAPKGACDPSSQSLDRHVFKNDHEGDENSSSNQHMTRFGQCVDEGKRGQVGDKPMGSTSLSYSASANWSEGGVLCQSPSSLAPSGRDTSGDFEAKPKQQGASSSVRVSSDPGFVSSTQPYQYYEGPQGAEAHRSGRPLLGLSSSASPKEFGPLKVSGASPSMSAAMRRPPGMSKGQPVSQYSSQNHTGVHIVAQSQDSPDMSGAQRLSPSRVTRRYVDSGPGVAYADASKSSPLAEGKLVGSTAASMRPTPCVPQHLDFLLVPPGSAPGAMGQRFLNGGDGKMMYAATVPVSSMQRAPGAQIAMYRPPMVMHQPKAPVPGHPWMLSQCVTPAPNPSLMLQMAPSVVRPGLGGDDTVVSEDLARPSQPKRRGRKRRRRVGEDEDEDFVGSDEDYQDKKETYYYRRRRAVAQESGYARCGVQQSGGAGSRLAEVASGYAAPASLEGGKGMGQGGQARYYGSAAELSSETVIGQPVEEEPIARSRPRRSCKSVQQFVDSDEDYSDSNANEEEKAGEAKVEAPEGGGGEALEEGGLGFSEKKLSAEVEVGDKTKYEYYVKWQGKSYMHCTWERYDTLMYLMGAKKLKNYVKQMMSEIEWLKTASPEEVEPYDIEKEMMRDLYDEYLKVDRVVAHRQPEPEPGGQQQPPEYLCVWCKLPYVEATWEKARDISQYQHKIDQYLARSQQMLVQRVFYGPRVIRPSFRDTQLLQETPEFLKGGELREYQLQGVNWLFYSWCHSINCILADEMGLGKTIQTVSFLAYLQFRHCIPGPFLVVVPLSTISNWEAEFAKWAPDMNVVVYMTDSVSRRLIREYEFYCTTPSGKKTTKFNVLITSYEIVLKDKQYLSNIKWNFLVVDEAHRLKNSGSVLHEVLNEFVTSARLLITGTPLQNSLRELWALLNFLEPQRFPSWEEFERQFSNLEEAETVASLHAHLKPHLLRRMKKDVEKSLPAKKERILRVGMSLIQKKYYQWVLTRNFAELNRGLGRQAQSTLSNIVIELKKVCNHPYLFPNAEQLVHEAALRQQQQQAQAEGRPVVERLSHEVVLEMLIRSSGKLMLLDKLLLRLKETGHRVLIFSQMVRMLDILAYYMRARGFHFQRLDGSMSRSARQVAMESFNAESSKDFCFLLSTRAGGLGINLSTADTVIIFDSDWNPQNDLQAESRAHRIGQKNVVNIYRLLVKDTVEEDILERAKKKLILDYVVIQRLNTRTGQAASGNARSNLSRGALEGGRSGFFSKDELADIIRFGATELFKDSEEQLKLDSKGQLILAPSSTKSQLLEDIDINEILERAEAASEQTEAAPGSELLSSFQVANFGVSEGEESDGKKRASNSEFWSDLIPPDLRSEGGRAEKGELAVLGPRRREERSSRYRGEAKGAEGGLGGAANIRHRLRQRGGNLSYQEGSEGDSPSWRGEESRSSRRDRPRRRGSAETDGASLGEASPCAGKARTLRSRQESGAEEEGDENRSAGSPSSADYLSDSEGDDLARGSVSRRVRPSRAPSGGKSKRAASSVQHRAPKRSSLAMDPLLPPEEILTTSEMRRLLMAFREFGSLDRVDSIVRLANLSKKNVNMIRQTLEHVLRECREEIECVQSLLGKGERGPDSYFLYGHHFSSQVKPIITFLNVPTNAAQLLQRVSDLTELSNMISCYPDPLLFRVNFTVKPWTQFASTWSSPVDDSMLLLGVHRHGMGQWAAISQDESLGLRSKILVPNGPVGAQVAQRVDSLLKQMREAKYASSLPDKAAPHGQFSRSALKPSSPSSDAAIGRASSDDPRSNPLHEPKSFSKREDDDDEDYTGGRSIRRPRSSQAKLKRSVRSGSASR
ncbi:uncharacterized protein LOC126325484 [Schistocerca gregaria]|uniref:uncharacterized protein LOC126325484 n=1 Tax=Schistocerca gregaria TaxID=7010 RepID=UPI00211DC91F|nr:uncharacterized protein LOC126325484 [Schistocerca gregaria]